jgi:hypothetical protein
MHRQEDFILKRESNQYSLMNRIEPVFTIEQNRTSIH